MKLNHWKYVITAALLVATPLASFSISAAPSKKAIVAVSQKPKSKGKAPKPVAKALPRLLDLGSDKCVPCKMMIPVLNDLSKEYKGKLKVEMIDVWKNRKAGEKYKVQSIPTQIFFDQKGKEFYRHVGFIPKDEILTKFKQHGIKLTK